MTRQSRSGGDVAVVVLAAGKGTRMKSRLHKLLHPVAGRPMLEYVLRAVEPLAPVRILVVVGHGAGAVRERFADFDLEFVPQEQQLGTGHALMMTRPLLEDFDGDILVVNGDGPLVTSDTFAELLKAHRGRRPGMTFLSYLVDDPSGLGRVIRDAEGCVLRIVEDGDLEAAEAAIREIIPGCFLFDRRVFQVADAFETDNAQQEHYITDLPGLYLERGLGVEAVMGRDDAGRQVGVNTRAQLAVAESVLRARIRHRWLEAGVTMHAPETTLIDDTVELAADVTLETGVVLTGATRVGSGATIGANAVLNDAEVAPGEHVPPTRCSTGTTEDRLNQTPSDPEAEGARSTRRPAVTGGLQVVATAPAPTAGARVIAVMALLDKPHAVLALEDGAVYPGFAFGYAGSTVGEVVFNTSMTGYQEILTDPSYHGQIVTMTYPHIGNYGVSVYDMESNRPFAKGFIVREFSRVASNHRANQDLQSFMKQHRIVGIEGVDTRALTRRLRRGGVVKGVIRHGPSGQGETRSLIEEARSHPDIDGRDMTPEVTTPLPYARPTFQDDPRVVVIDFGIKHSIVYKLEQSRAEVIVVPAQTTPAQIMALDPMGLVLSNGPGDPDGPKYAHDTVWQLLGLLPTYGICMGHQLLGLAVGGRTFKLTHGHHGANTPVKNLITGKVEITSQNHNYAVDIDSIPGGQYRATHINLNDGTLEGMAHLRYPVFSVQYHPEASPGPHDANYLFRRFIEEVNAFEGATALPAARVQNDL